MSRVAELSRLIGLVYQGTLEATPWESVLRYLNRHLHASGSALVLRPASKEQPALMIEAQEQTVRVSTAEHILFYLYSLDPFAHLPPDRFVTPEDLIGEDQWRSGEYFKQYLAPIGIHYMLGADFHADNDSECRLRLWRPRGAGPFSATDRALCELLLPHFKTAVNLHSYLYRVESERTLYAGTLDRMRLGVVLLDESGRVLSTNVVAEQLLARETGLLIHEHKLRAVGKEPDQRLQRLIRRALCGAVEANPVTEAMAINRRSGNQLSVVVKPTPSIPRLEGRRRPTAVIFLRDPRYKSLPSGESLQVLFNLTPAETALAILLAEGLSLDQCSKRLEISKNTVKSRLRSIFAKTATSRQAALVRVLLETPGPL